MDNQIIISFNGMSEAEIAENAGTIISVNWDALLPTISQYVRLRDDEVINGLVVTDADVRVKISRKKGRKTNSKNKTVIPDDTDILFSD